MVEVEFAKTLQIITDIGSHIQGSDVKNSILSKKIQELLDYTLPLIKKYNMISNYNQILDTGCGKYFI